MSLIEKLFGSKTNEPKQQSSYFKTISGYSPVYRTRDGGVYEMELTRAAIHAIANHCSKLKPELVGSAAKKYKYMLELAPNEYMTTSQFIYRLVTILQANTTAFIVPIYDRYGEQIKGLYPILPQAAEVIESQNKLWVAYQFAQGEKRAIEFDKVGILRTHQYKNDFFGDGNEAVLKDTLDLLFAQNQSTQEAFRNSALVRFLVKLTGAQRPEAIAEQKKRFVEDNLRGNGGAIVVDHSVESVTPINQHPFNIDANQTKLINENVYNYFGVNEDILNNSYSEDTWNAFYEGCIETVALQLSQVLTRMLFTETECAYGNEIQFSSNRLQYASNKTKIEFVQTMVDRGMMSINDGLAVFNMPPVEDGDKRVIRGEYISTNNIETNIPASKEQEDAN